MYARQRVQPTGTNRPRAWIDNDVRARCGVLSRARAPGFCLLRSSLTTDFGGHSGGVTPVPIPNTEVKPTSADGTWEETPWESRSPPDFSDRTGPFGAPFFVFLPVHLVRYAPAHGLLRTPSLVPSIGWLDPTVDEPVDSRSSGGSGVGELPAVRRASLGFAPIEHVRVRAPRGPVRRGRPRPARARPGAVRHARRDASPSRPVWPAIRSGAAWPDGARGGSRRAGPAPPRPGAT